MKTFSFFLLLLLPVGFTACNSSGRNGTNNATSDTMPPPDTSANMMPPGGGVDTAGMNGRDTMTTPMPMNSDSAGKRGGDMSR